MVCVLCNGILESLRTFRDRARFPFFTLLNRREDRLLVTLNDINKSTVLERFKKITVDSSSATEATPAVDDKDLLIRTLEIKLLSRNETINCMEKTLLENIKNMQELHVAQHGL